MLGSRHLAYAYPVRSEEEAKEKIDQLWKEHAQATHICFAWRIGWEKKIYRLSDDGEPSGTAGKPIYGQIQSADLTNVVIAVVRYFGGTKLGTGGLIDAYKTAARLAIEAATVIEKPVMKHYRLRYAYALMPQVMKLLKDLNWEKIAAEMAEECTAEFLLRKQAGEQLESQMMHWPEAELELLGMA